MGGIKSLVLGTDSLPADFSDDDPFGSLGSGDPGARSGWIPEPRGASSASSLDARRECAGGARLRADPIAAGTSTNLTVHLRGHRRLSLAALETLRHGCDHFVPVRA